MNVQNVGINGRNKYLDILDAAWQEHLIKRDDNAPTVISLFAGAGGSSLGYSMAGYKELLAVEWNDNAVETFKLNFPDVPVWHGDITKLSVDKCLEVIGLEPGELDVLDGSPPCQGFSISGNRQLDDPRNSLAIEFIRLLRELQPKVFVMENVSGLIKGKMKLIFTEIMKELKASGYQVKCQLMNTMYFNVPQSRQRLIWIGVRDDLGLDPSLPNACHKPFTVRDAFYMIPDDFNPNLLQKGLVSKIIKNMLPGEDGGKASQRISGNRNKWFNLRRLSYSLPGFTITKSYGSSTLIHPVNDRALNIAEFRRISSFPDSFTFTGNYKQSKERIGNSVPPLFMKAIAEHIRDEILIKVNMTGGEPELLCNPHSIEEPS